MVPAPVLDPDRDSGHGLESPKAKGSDQVTFFDPLVLVHPSSMLSSRSVFMRENSAIISEGALALGKRLRLSLRSGIPVFK
jgi:hypothetical protein